MDSHISNHDSGIYPLFSPQKLQNGNATISKQASHIKRSALILLTLCGYLFLYSFPLIALTLSTHLLLNFPYELNYSNLSLIALEILTATICLALSYYIYKLKADPPVGRQLNPVEYPELFKLINEICDEHRYHRLDKVKLTRNFEITCTKTPLNGFLFSFENTLVIGLPLMQSISAKQLRLAISREVFQLAGYRKRLSSFVAFNVDNWHQLKTTNQLSTQFPRTLFHTVFSWYSLLYGFLTKSIRNQEQLLADRVIHSKTPENDYIELLLTLLIAQNYLQQSFWPQLYSKAYKHATPPYLPYSSIERHIKINIDKKQARSWINIALKSHENTSATPSFISRISNLYCEEIKVPTPVKLSAASYFLESGLDEITQTMDKLWLYRHQDEWDNKYKKGLIEINKLKELAIQAKHGLLSDIKAWEYIQLIKLYLDKNKAIILYKQILRINTKDPRICFDIGRSLLEALDPTGIDALERTMHQDATYTVPCYQLITRYYMRTGNNKLAQTYRRKSLVHQLEVA